jgi:hypothetical protein
MNSVVEWIVTTRVGSICASFFFFSALGFELMLVRQGLYHLSHSTSGEWVHYKGEFSPFLLSHSWGSVFLHR